MKTGSAGKRRNGSTTLSVTFIVGFLIGVSFFYPAAVLLGYDLTRAGAPPPSPEPPVDQSPEPQPEKPEAEPPDALYVGAGLYAFDEGVWAARRLFVGVSGTELDADGQAFFRALRPGGVVLRPENLESAPQTARLVRQLKEAVSFGAADHLLPVTALCPEPGVLNPFAEDGGPTPAALGSEGDAAQARAVGQALGRACKERGINAVFAPSLDVYEPGGALESLAKTSFGRDQAVVTALGLAYAAGLMEEGVMPVAKHYPGLGAARRNAETGRLEINKDVPDLAALIYPFAEAASQGIPGIMTAHAAAPILEQAEPDKPASVSAVLVRRLLREHWQFTGVVLTADLADDPAVRGRGVARTAVEALQAGCDAVVFTDPQPDRIHAVCVAIEQAAAAGTLDRETLQAGAKRLDEWLGWIEQPAPLREPMPAEPDAAPDAAEPEAGESYTPFEFVEPPVEDAAAPPAPEEEAAPEEDALPVNVMAVEMTVREGDTLEALAERFGVDPADVKAWNGLEDDALTPGMVLQLEAPLEFVAPELAEPAPEPDEDVAERDAAEEAQALMDDAPASDAPDDAEAEKPEVIAHEPETGADAFEAGVSDDAAPESEDPAADAADDAAAEPAMDDEMSEFEGPEPDEAAAAAETPGHQTRRHKVMPGESLYSIAQEYGVPMQALKTWNNLESGKIRSGQYIEVRVKPSETTEEPVAYHRVAPGENLYVIADKYDTTTRTLLELNPELTNPNKLFSGRRLKVPKRD